MGKHEKERDGFKSRTGFILACIGSAVGTHKEPLRDTIER